jgi:TRAP-type mannitol/chloroaromatic compound transport system permease small subunit
MRYAFNKGNVGLQELEWHLFAIIFLIGAAYTLKEGGHVRVDIPLCQSIKKSQSLD